MDGSGISRREFLLRASLGAGSVWMTASWPAILAAHEHARRAARSAAPPKLEFLTAEQAADLDAIAAQIIPADDTPGAREARVVYFMDKALVTFARDQQEPLREGLKQVQLKLRELYPQATTFATATAEQQMATLKAIEKTPAFGLLRAGVVAGFLSDPERGGNFQESGWKTIGFDSAHIFQPPFGYYDRDYPGFESAAKKDGEE